MWSRGKRAGLAGAIVARLARGKSPAPWPRSAAARTSVSSNLITPTTPRDRALRIAERTTGFIYYVSVAGITGERTELPPDIVENVGWLREQTPLPICIGFGISRPEHIRLLAPVADGPDRRLGGGPPGGRSSDQAPRSGAGGGRPLWSASCWRRCGSP